MRELDYPTIEFISFTAGDVIATSCPTHNCANPLGYGDLCTNGHDDCTTYVPDCPEDDPF